MLGSEVHDPLGEVYPISICSRKILILLCLFEPSSALNHSAFPYMTSVRIFSDQSRVAKYCSKCINGLHKDAVAIFSLLRLERNEEYILFYVLKVV